MLTMMIEEPNGKQLTFDLKDDFGTVKYWFVDTGIYRICAKYSIASKDKKKVIPSIYFLYYISDSSIESTPTESTDTDVGKLAILTKFIDEIKGNLNEINNLQERSLVNVRMFKDAEVELSSEIRYFAVIECILVLIAGIWQTVSLRMYFKKRQIK